MITLYSRSALSKSPIDLPQPAQTNCTICALSLVDEENAFNRDYSIQRFVCERNEARVVFADHSVDSIMAHISRMLSAIANFDVAFYEQQRKKSGRYGLAGGACGVQAEHRS